MLDMLDNSLCRRKRLSHTTAFLFICINAITISAVLSNHANAFEEDIHYYATFALALTSGWSWEESRAIASADIAMDTNEAVVAKLHFLSADTLKGAVGVRQSEGNYFYHCFSHEKDDAKIQGIGPHNPDVMETLKEYRNFVFRDNNQKTLFKIGAYLHCQQDSWSHHGFGGKAFGHVWESFIGDNPDRPSQRPPQTEHAMDEAYKELYKLHTGADGQFLPEAQTDTLIKALETNTSEDDEDGDISGLRYHCNKLIIETWLHKSLHKQNRLHLISETDLETVPHSDWQQECLKVPPTARYFAVKIPDPQRLGVSGIFGGLKFDEMLAKNSVPSPMSHVRSSPFDANTLIGFRLHPVVHAAPSSITVQERPQFDYQLTGVSVTEKQRWIGEPSCLYRIDATVRNGGPNLTSAAFLLAAVIPGPESSVPEDQLTNLYQEVAIDPLPPGYSKELTTYIDGKHSCPEWESNIRRRNAFWVRVQAPMLQEPSERIWGDVDISNNLIDRKNRFIQPLPGTISSTNIVPLVSLSSSSVLLSLTGLVLIFTEGQRRWYTSASIFLGVGMCSSLFLITIAWFLQQAGFLVDFNLLGAKSNPFYSPSVPTSLFSFNLLCYGMIASMTLWGLLQAELTALRLSMFIAVWLVLGYGYTVSLYIRNIRNGYTFGHDYFKAFGAVDYANGILLHLIPGVTAVAVLFILKGDNPKAINTRTQTSKYEGSGYGLLCLGGLCLVNSTRIVEGGFGAFAGRFVLIAVLSAFVCAIYLKVFRDFPNSNDAQNIQWVLWSSPVVGLASALPPAGLANPYLSAPIVGIGGVVLVSYLGRILLRSLGSSINARLLIPQVVAGTWGLFIVGYISSEKYNLDGFNGSLDHLYDQMKAMIYLWTVISAIALIILFYVGGDSSRQQMGETLGVIFGRVWEFLKKLRKRYYPVPG